MAVLVNPRNTRQQARTLFPNWTRRQRATWVLAKLRAAHVRQRWGQMVPRRIEDLSYIEQQFTPRIFRGIAR